MSKPRKTEHKLFQKNYLIGNYQQNLSTLQLENLKLELKQEKLRDKIVYQSIKDKIEKSLFNEV